MSADAHDATLAGLRLLGLIGADEAADLVPLTGGVASDIWLVTGVRRPFVVKRALEKLRVAADWRAPVSRNAAEVAWLRRAAEAAPDAVPHVIAHDPGLGFFAMDYLAPEAHPVWKKELRDGRADVGFAGAVGSVLSAIHRSTAGQSQAAGEFNDDTLFRAIRIEPYLLFTADRHPEVAVELARLGSQTLATHSALVHGDTSPKNILMGPKGPIFLDAECAWYGDPAFDLAFCLNHLLLKCLWNRDAQAGFLASFEALATHYIAGVRWEDPGALEARAAALLPGLLLARVDGKSPVEYITTEPPRAFVRAFAVPRIKSPPATLHDIRLDWANGLANAGDL